MKDTAPHGEPAFVLSSAAGVLLADRAVASFTRVAEAQDALSSGTAPMVLGALPFDPHGPAALIAPDTVQRLNALPGWPTQPMPAVHVTAELPDPASHRAAIRRVLDELAGPGNTLRKVVLARKLLLTADTALDARTVLRRLTAADPSGYGYLVDLTAAGAGYAGSALVGVSPELLVHRIGQRIICRPFAGTAPRSAEPTVDAENGAALARSAKNRHEHQLVVDQLRAVLEPLCSALAVESGPQLSRTAAVWHLSTTISGFLRESSTTAIDLALALHPTAAVAGVPTRQAVDLITELENDRGFYAGAVGWCDASGDGKWVVSIRCAQLSADRRHALTYAGGGIVAESNPDDELAETTTKFTTVLSALGTAPPNAPLAD